MCVHTHLPYHRILPSGRHVVNVGSVGKPKDRDPLACYVVLATEGGHFQVEFIRVAYDVEQAAQAIENTATLDKSAAILRHGAG